VTVVAPETPDVMELLDPLDLPVTKLAMELLEKSVPLAVPDFPDVMDTPAVLD